MSDLTKQSELKELALKIDALRKRRDDMLRSNNWIQNNQDEYILELDTQWPTISNALRSSASAGVREALESAERKLSAYVGVCKGDKELTEVVLPMLRSALSDHGVQNSAAGANTKSDGGVEGHALSYALAPQASASADALVHPAGIKPGPSDPSPGPDVREALEECKHWHERHDKALSKSGRGDADYYWRRDQHRQEIERIDTILSALTRPFAYGIIDPDYARIFTIARCIAWAEGYALAMHGSFTRDLDLIAVPWAAHACEPDHLARRIENAAALTISVAPKNDKPFGRLVWTMTLPTFADPRFVDLSVMPPAVAETNAAASGNTSLVSGASSEQTSPEHSDEG